jgi:alpha-methylacyl-CoA racemase
MMLADMGAEVIRIDRKVSPDTPTTYPTLGTKFDVMARGRRSLAVDLKHREAPELVLQLLEQADVLLEGFRPGVMERLSLGPDECLKRKPALVYGRITGWGQDGPLAKSAGHDLNYIALSGVLHGMGRPDTPPAPPLNLIGDFGGGGMMFAFGVLCALLESRQSGTGQVVDAAMLDGSALLGAMLFGLRAHGSWSDQRGTNILAGASHFYDTYLCADAKFISIGPIEPQFYALLLKLCGINTPDFDQQMRTDDWPELKAKIAAVFKSKSRQEWCDLLEGTDACFAPVLDMSEAPQHHHNRTRGTFIDLDGVIQPAPAPRFSRTIPEVSSPPAYPGQHSAAILKDWHISEERIGNLIEAKVI